MFDCISTGAYVHRGFGGEDGRRAQLVGVFEFGLLLLLLLLLLFGGAPAADSAPSACAYLCRCGLECVCRWHARSSARTWHGASGSRGASYPFPPSPTLPYPTLRSAATRQNSTHRPQCRPRTPCLRPSTPLAADDGHTSPRFRHGHAEGLKTYKDAATGAATRGCAPARCKEEGETGQARGSKDNRCSGSPEEQARAQSKGFWGRKSKCFSPRRIRAAVGEFFRENGDDRRL